MVRGIEFRLSFDEFMVYWKAKCFYCSYSIFTIGLDRIVNSKGYTPDNVVPACAVCNKMKNDMSQSVFLSAVAAIFRRCNSLPGFPGEGVSDCFPANAKPLSDIA